METRSRRVLESFECQHEVDLALKLQGSALNSPVSKQVCRQTVALLGFLGVGEADMIGPSDRHKGLATLRVFPLVLLAEISSQDFSKPMQDQVSRRILEA